MGDLTPNKIPINRDVPLDVVRRCYAEDVRVEANVRSVALVEAFATVPREHYLGPGPWLIPSRIPGKPTGGYRLTEGTDPRYLYHNMLVNLDQDRNLNNGHPSSLAEWLDALELCAGDRVFHIGCGLGYYTAIIAHVVGPTGRVLAVEIDPTLANRAAANLCHFPYVRVVAADGITHDPGPVDAIFVNAGVTHPQKLWLERLGPHGRLLLPLTMTVGTPHQTSSVSSGQMLLVRETLGRYAARFVSTAIIFPSVRGRDPSLNEALRSAFMKLMTGQQQPVQSLRCDPHTPDETCWLHGRDFCFSANPLAWGSEPDS